MFKREDDQNLRKPCASRPFYPNSLRWQMLDHALNAFIKANITRGSHGT